MPAVQGYILDNQPMTHDPSNPENPGNFSPWSTGNMANPNPKGKELVPRSAGALDEQIVSSMDDEDGRAPYLNRGLAMNPSDPYQHEGELAQGLNPPGRDETGAMRGSMAKYVEEEQQNFWQILKETGKNAIALLNEYAFVAKKHVNYTFSSFVNTSTGLTECSVQTTTKKA